MKFLVDAQLPPALCAWLDAHGHEAIHVVDVGLIAGTDSEIAAHAEATRSVLITKDEDFLILQLPDRFSLLWLRCGNSTNRALIAWLAPRWQQIETLLESGERMVEVR